MQCIVKATDLGVLEPAPKNALSETEIKQFRRTAELVSKSPWNLFEAAQYTPPPFIKRFLDRLDSGVFLFWTFNFSKTRLGMGHLSSHLKIHFGVSFLIAFYYKGGRGVLTWSL